LEEQTLLRGDIRKQLIRLAVPLLLGNILQQLYNTADALIIGRFLGTDAFAAVGIGGTVMNLFIFILNGFCFGLTVLFSQFHGAGDRDSFRKEFFVSFGLGGALTAILSGVSLLLLHHILRWMQTPGELMASVTAYLQVILAGLIATYGYNLFSSVLRALGDTRASLYFLLLSVVLNVALDYLWVAVLPLGVAGAAWATVAAQALSALCCFFYLRGKYRALICTRADVGFHQALISRTLGYGLTSALQQSSLYIGKLLVQGTVNTLGSAGIAAFTAATRIEGLANSFGDSGAHALSVFVSQNRGAGQGDRVKEGLRHGMAIHLVLGVALSALMFATSAVCIAFFLDTEDPHALAAGNDYLRLVSVFYLLCFIGSAFVGYFRGMGRFSVPVVGTTLHITIRVILSSLLVPPFGLPAVAAATGVGWTCVVVYQFFTYKRQKKSPTS